MLLSARLRLPSFTILKHRLVVFQHKQIQRNARLKVNVHNKHDIFDFKVDTERKDAIIQQVNMHGGLNKLLTRHGHCPLETCKQAIEKAFALGLICMHTYKECIEINKKSNRAKHRWP